MHVSVKLRVPMHVNGKASEGYSPEARSLTETEAYFLSEPVWRADSGDLCFLFVPLFTQPPGVPHSCPCTTLPLLC